MERLLLKDLLNWKNKKNRKPLIIQGARQVGKTWIMKEFGNRYFENVAYVNFDNNSRMSAVFAQDYDIDRILSAIRIETNCRIDAENTLIIFDEIQEVPRALGSLKYFYENASQYAIVAAGSLLGAALHQGTSFPVGKVDFLKLYPLSFAEFLMATGNEPLIELMNQGDMDLIAAFSEKYVDLLKRYYFVGGMPEAVQTYIETDDLNAVRAVQKDLLRYYEEDFSKHAPMEQVPRLRMVWNSLLTQLSKENRKFVYGIVRQGARAKDYEIAIQWLADCGLVYKSVRITKPGLPLNAYLELSSFKLFMLDIGLLCAKGDLPPRIILEKSSIFAEFKGAMTEQFVAQELQASGRSLYYYSTENSTGEIDFMLQEASECIPLEVKAEENLKARSLRAFCEKYHPSTALRSSMSNYREQEWMTNVPLYMLISYLNRCKEEYPT